MCSHRSPRGDRKRLKEESIPLFVLFVLFGQAKRTLKEKKHKDSFLLSYFSVKKRRVQGGEATSERRRRDGVYQKSARRTHAVLLATTAACTSLSCEPCVASVCGKGQRGNRQCRATRNFSCTTRANISHEKAEQIRARIACTPAESARRACGSACADGMEYIFFAFSVGYAWAYLVGRELTDLRSHLWTASPRRASWV